jgi:hypothetical protein
VVIGLVVQAVGMIAVGAVASFPAILAAYAFWGLGWTFQNGWLEAWITDELGPENLGGTFARASGPSTRERWAASASASRSRAGDCLPPGGVLTATVGIALVIVMPQTGFRRRRRERTGPEAIARTLAGLGSLASIRAALLGATALLVPTFALYSRTAAAGGAGPELTEAEAPASG